MKARVKKIQEVGSCSYCEKGELKADGMGLEYPYDEVVEISGKQVVSRLCFECVQKLSEFQEFF